MISLINILGSIALLLWGIRMVRTAITRGFGADLRALIAMADGHRGEAFGAGIATTVLLQSSTATSLLVASFSNRAGIASAVALAILLGADVGTTLVVQLFTHRVEWLAPLLVLIGVIRFLTSDRARPRNLGRAGIGLGLIMLALQLIGVAASQVTGAEAVKLVLAQLSNEPFLMILIVGLITMLLHSSVAVVMLVAAMAAGGAVSQEGVVAMVLGANLGGALLPVIAAFPLGRAARIAPVSNAGVRFAGVFLCALTTPTIANLLTATGLGAAVEVALFHTVFNLMLAVCALPFTAWITNIADRLMPAVTPAADPDRAAHNLDEQGLETPAVALACATREALRIGELIKQMLAGSMEAIRRDDATKRKSVEALDDDVDRLYEAIKLYLARLTREELDRHESERSIEVLSFTTNLEHVGDIIDKNLMELAAKKAKAKAHFSTDGLAEIEALHQEIMANLDLALNVFVSGDLGLARRLLAQKTVIRDRERRSVESHFARISKGQQVSIDSSSLHVDIVRDFKRINSHLCAVAYPILERANELAESRLLNRDQNNPKLAG